MSIAPGLVQTIKWGEKMAQVQVVHGSSKQWVTVLALVGAAMVTVLWGWSHREDGAVRQAMAAAAAGETAGVMAANRPVSATVQRVSTDAISQSR